ncbi:unnamed protein product [Sphagnum jensenii]
MVQDDTEEKKVVAAVLVIEKDNVGWAEEIADKTDGNNVHGITYQESVKDTKLTPSSQPQMTDAEDNL